MTEKLLQFIWQFGYFNKTNLTTTVGEPVTVVFGGRISHNQGPDFNDAKIRIGGTLLAGSVELHLRTSLWKVHGHDSDNAYNKVILHVVFQHDEVFQNPIPVLELQGRIATVMLARYEALMHNVGFIPCEGVVAQVPELVWISWKERLVAERLARKAGIVQQLLQETGGHWEAVFWWLLARSFGSKVNGDAFEAVARSLPLTVLAKQRHSIQQLEALLLGQAGFLNENASDSYTELLQREYRFLKTKYGLTPSPIPVQFLRMRPGNFPTVRLAQLAMILYTSQHLFSKLLDETDVKTVIGWLQVTANDYWHYHYRPDVAASYKPKTVGQEMAVSIIINTVAPVLFAYGLHHNQDAQKEKAVHWLQQLDSEHNNITTGFVQCGINNKAAYDSQALIELKTRYCDERRCLHCAVGASLLKAKT